MDFGDIPAQLNCEFSDAPNMKKNSRFFSQFFAPDVELFDNYSVSFRPRA